MTNKKTNSVGFTGIFTDKASFNRNLEPNGGSRQTASGIFYATHYKLKWLIRNYWARANGEKSVLVKSSQYVSKDGNISVRTLEERIQHVFDLSAQQFKDLKSKSLYDLVISKRDIKNFGGAIPIKGKQVKITGVSQISYATNIFKETEELGIQNNSAYASKVGDSQPTIGSRRFLDFANYIYPFTVQPDMLSENVVGFEGAQYTEDDYNWLKKGMLKGVQLNQSASSGSYTGYALFVDLKEGEDIIQSNFQDYVTCEFNADSKQYDVDLTILAEYLGSNKDSIESSEFYHIDNIKINFIGLEKLSEQGVVIKDMVESRTIEVQE